MPNNWKEAAQDPDWTQPLLHRGAPCFYVEDGEFCFRADRWAGHPKVHPFVSLASLLDSVVAEERERCAKIAMRMGYLYHDEAVDPQCDDSEDCGSEIARRIREGRSPQGDGPKEGGGR